jgi:hypothetical protein
MRELIPAEFFREAALSQPSIHPPIAMVDNRRPSPNQDLQVSLRSSLARLVPCVHHR